MQIVKFITFDDEKIFCWCTTNQINIYKDYIQYILDSYSNPKNFYILDTSTQKYYNMYEVATKHYKMRKRTFYEKMNDIKTGIL